MTDLHAQLEEWLADGPLGDPPREIALHASVCERCSATLGAFDALALIDVGVAGSPPPLGARSRLRMGMAWARVGTAVTATVLAGLLVGFGIAQLVGINGPAGGTVGEPEGTQLAGLFHPSNDGGQSQEPSNDSTPGAAPTPTELATPQPGTTPEPLPVFPPGVTPPPPLPVPTAPPTATPAPTVEPTPSPAPECADGQDNDLDGWVDFPADQGCTSPSDDEAPVDFHECNNNIDDDGDGYTDLNDPGCGGNPFDDTEFPPDLHQCNDGLDNDGDSLVDLSDPGCAGNPFGDSEEPPNP